MKDFGAGLNLKIKMVKKAEVPQIPPKEPMSENPKKEMEKTVEEEEIEVTP